MAVIAQQDDNEDKNTGQASIAGTGGASSSGGTAGQGGSATPVSQVKQNAAPQANQGYTDVASYLNANQQGSGKLGDQVSKNLTNKYNQTKSGIDTSYGQFQGDVNKGYTQENTDLINQVAANPTQAAGNQDTLAAYQAQLNDQYTGPQNWADLGTQQGKVNEANQYGSLANTPGGLNVYTQEVEGQTGGPQSQGINQLDTLLLGGTPGAMGQIQAAADPYKGLNDYINSQNMAGQQAVTGAKTNAQNASQHALDAFTGQNGALTGLNNQITSEAQRRQNEALTAQQTLQNDIKNLYGGQALDTTPGMLGGYGGSQNPWYNTTNYNVGQLSPQDLQQLGITQEQWNELQGGLQQAGTATGTTGTAPGGHNFGAWTPTTQIDIGQWLQQQDPMTAISAANTATPEQYQKMSAIQQLLGSKTPQGNAINPALASLAGTAPASLNQFDYGAAQQGVGGYNQQALQAAIEAANSLNAGADLAHAESQHNHGFLGGLKNDITHPLNSIGAIMPWTWAGNAQSALKGHQVNGTNVNPLKPQ